MFFNSIHLKKEFTSDAIHLKEQNLKNPLRFEHLYKLDYKHWIRRSFSYDYLISRDYSFLVSLDDFFLICERLE